MTPSRPSPDLPGLTVIIPLKDDPRILSAIASLPKDGIEILAVFNNNPSANLQSAVQKTGARVLCVDTAKLSVARNEGIRHSRSDSILFLDSDCRAGEDCVGAVQAALKHFPVVKPLLVYDAHSWETRITAKVRQYTTVRTSLPLLPLAFRKDIVEAVGGYYFDERLAWGEDWDFAERIAATHPMIPLLEEATIVHEALSFRDDLRSAAKIGNGRSLQVEHGLQPARSLVRDVLMAGEHRKFAAVMKTSGIGAALYHTLGWRLAYKVGYYRSRRPMRVQSLTETAMRWKSGVESDRSVAHSDNC